MEERINVAEILKDCPTGMELDCTVFEKLTFEEIDEVNSRILCNIQGSNGKLITISFNKFGCYSELNQAKCVLFPKGKTTWEGFQRPFKDGDIVATKNGLVIGIVKVENDGLYKTYCTINGIGSLAINYSWYFDRFATEDEKNKLFKAIKDNGFKWNEETKTLEKLAPDKFDINALVPFESRVLVRNSKTGRWKPAIWGFYTRETNYCVLGGICWLYCIPYEGNEHLRGTTDDCDEYFKIWK